MCTFTEALDLSPGIPSRCFLCRRRVTDSGVGISAVASGWAVCVRISPGQCVSVSALHRDLPGAKGAAVMAGLITMLRSARHPSAVAASPPPIADTPPALSGQHLRVPAAQDDDRIVLLYLFTHPFLQSEGLIERIMYELAAPESLCAALYFLGKAFLSEPFAVRPRGVL